MLLEEHRRVGCIHLFSTDGHLWRDLLPVQLLLGLLVAMISDAVLQDDSKNIVRNWCKRKRVVEEGFTVMQRKERHKEGKVQYSYTVERHLRQSLNFHPCVMIYMYKCSWLEWWGKIEINQLKNWRKKDIYGFLCDDVSLTFASTYHLDSAISRGI